MANPKFNVGDTVWLASCGSKDKQIPCEVCFGAKKVKLTLGNGEECVLDCEYCGKGCEGPKGYIRIYEWAAEPIVGVIKGLSTYDGVKYSYTFHNNYSGEEESIFTTKEGAIKKCEEGAIQHAKEQQRCLESQKFNDKKNYSWNAGYHRSEAKRAEKDLKYHTQKAIFMAAKVKEAKNEI